MPKTGKRIGLFKNVRATDISGIGILDTADMFCRAYSPSSGYSYAENIAFALNHPLIVYDPITSGYDLSSALTTAASSSRVLFLPAGTYTVNTLINSTYSSTPFPIGTYSIIGEHPESVIIIPNDANQTTRADGAIGSWEPTGTLRINLGYLAIKIRSHSDTSYENCLFHGTGSGNLDYITMKNVAVNRMNTAFSMQYDNGMDTSPIRINNCSFLNTSSFLSSYSGSQTNKTVNNSIFDRTIPGATLFTYTQCVDGVTYSVDGNYVKYNTTTYNTAGHLYNLEDVSYTSPI
jgi:hypothetical protein